MKEGLIALNYECSKCNERMGLYERKSAVLDGDFEWVCSTITSQNIYGRTPMIILLTMRPSRLFVKIRCHAVASTRKRSAVRNQRPILASTPQGSILSPGLYNIYTCDFPIDNNITVGLFADDAAILCTRKTVEETINLTPKLHLQTGIMANQMEDSHKHRQTPCYCFRKLRSHNSPPPLQIFNSTIEWTFQEIPWTHTQRQSHNCGFHLSSTAEPTTIPKRANHRPATIDFGISCGLDDVLVETQVELSSDHNPVQFILPVNSDKPHAQNCTTFTNWNLFQDL
ncbi:hypothetical protein TNCV_3135931 [Trichonephila clavipes]|nr:hypothetical protein TNCV_3135931 [Trichonephila clavipes]